MFAMNTVSVFRNKNDLHFYIPGIIAAKYTYKQVSDSTGYSVRQLQRIVKRFKMVGEEAFVHRSTGHVAYNKTSEAIKNKILSLYATEYSTINFNYFLECLKEDHDISISYPTLLSIMNEAGIRSPEAHKIKKKKVVHRPRLRRKNEGDLIQLDGTPFQWFSMFGDQNYYDIMGAIDDATGKITGLYMTSNECFYGYSEVMRQTINNFGRPREVYTDRAAIFCCTPKKKANLTVWEQLEGIKGKVTQWQRVLTELNIRQVLAWTPQAKGRVERMWRTVQWRLPFWFYRNGINTVEAANKALPKFIEYFNDHFAVEAKKPETFWLPGPNNLDDILCAQVPRLTDSSGCFSFHGYKFAVMGSRVACKNITLCISERGINARLDGKYYDIKLMDDYIHSVVSDNIPEVLKDIMYKYLYQDQKEVSA